MNEPFYRYLEVALYALLNFLPYLILALYPFRKQLRFSKPVIISLIFIISILQILTGICAAFEINNAMLSILSTALYAIFYFTATKVYFGKSLFTLLILSNMANLVMVFAKCLEGILFGSMAYESYRWTNSFCMLIGHLLFTTPVAVYFYKSYSVSINKPHNNVWRYLWLVPATFYLAWYWHLYGQGRSSLEVALEPVNTLFLLLIDIGSFVIYHMILRLIHELNKNMELEMKNHQLAMQTLQYENLRTKIAEARRAKHDIRHHITLMREYLHNGNLDELERYLDQYQKSLPSDSGLIFSNNYTLNTLLLYFAQEAKNYGIDYDVRIDLQENLWIPENDLSVLLGNLLENAIHACAEQSNGERKIIIRAKETENTIFLTIDNTFDGELKQSKDGSYLSTKLNGNGLGLMSVRSITEQYHGTFEIETQENLFCVSVALSRG